MMSNQEVGFSRIQRAKESIEYLWSRGFISEYEYNTITDKIADEEEAYYEKHPNCHNCLHHLDISGTHSFGCIAVTGVDDKIQFNGNCKYFERGTPSTLNPVLSAEELKRRCDFGEPKSEILKFWLESLERGLRNEVN